MTPELQLFQELLEALKEQRKDIGGWPRSLKAGSLIKAGCPMSRRWDMG
jgi:hypothetical protein